MFDSLRHDLGAFQEANLRVSYLGIKYDTITFSISSGESATATRLFNLKLNSVTLTSSSPVIQTKIR